MTDRPSRNKLDVKRYINLTLSNLASCYAHQKSGATVNDFLAAIVAPIVQRDDRSVEDPSGLLMLFVSDSDKAKGPSWISKSPYGPIVVSCVYCVRAGDALREGDTELAWSYMADARYWCGVAISSKGINEAREETVLHTRETAFVEALKNKGKSGADARNKAYEPVREYAYRLARERRPDSGWRSRSHAVKVISEATYEFSVKNSEVPELKKEGIGKTLDGWLAKMPDADELFPSRKIKS